MAIIGEMDVFGINKDKQYEVVDRKSRQAIEKINKNVNNSNKDVTAGKVWKSTSDGAGWADGDSMSDNQSGGVDITINGVKRTLQRQNETSDSMADNENGGVDITIGGTKKTVAKQADLKEIEKLQNELKSDLGAYLINEFTTGAYFPIQGYTIDISNSISDPIFDCKIIQCAPKQSFRITGHGGNNARLYVFADIFGNVLLASQSSATANNEIITAPYKSAYLIVNFSNAYPYNITANTYESNAVNNILQKSSNWVSVEEFGAVGDGVTDNTMALQSAFSSGFNIIFKHNATYKCNDIINITELSNVSIIGNEASIILDKTEYATLESNIGFINFENCSNVNLSMLHICTTQEWVRRPAENSGDFATYIAERNKSYTAIMVRNSNLLTFRNVECNNVRNGIFLSYVTNSVVEGFYIHHTFADAVLITGASRRINVLNCNAELIDDDCYSADGFGSGISTNPAYVNFSHCNVNDCIGGLICLEGSFYTTATSCNGNLLSLKPIKLGYLTDEGANAKGDYQIVDKCYFDISSAYLGADYINVVVDGADIVHAKITNCTIINRFSDIELRFKNTEIVISENKLFNVGARFINTSANIVNNIINCKGGFTFLTGFKKSLITGNNITFNDTTATWYEGADFTIGDTDIVINGNIVTSNNANKNTIQFKDGARLRTDYGHFTRSVNNYYKIRYVGTYDLDLYDVLLSNWENGQFVKKDNAIKCVWDGSLI